MAVPYEARPPVRQLEIPHVGQERISFQLDRLRKKTSCTRSQHIRQGIVDLIRLT
jgi:hypothetical protein